MTAKTFVMFSQKSQARRVCRRLMDHAIVAGVRGERGHWEVFGFIPQKMTADTVRTLALRIYRERKAA